MIELIEAYDDAAAARVASVIAACVAAGEQPPLDEAALLHLHHHGLQHATLCLDDGGFALVRSHGAGHAFLRELDLAVAPTARRRGIGRALLGSALDAVPDAPVGAVPDGGPAVRPLCPPAISAWAHGDHPGAAALAAATGFRRTRELLVLTAGPEVVHGFAQQAARATAHPLRAWRTHEGDELLRVNARAFADHPEQGALDADGLAQRMAEPWFDPEGLLVAEGSAGLLGFHWTKVHGDGSGEIYVLAVDPTAQGTGLGHDLALAGLAHLAGRGVPRIHLYVESDNGSALALYRRLGFVTDHVHAQYTRP